ncbi:MAG: AgmX/PglI C-terminal domain-containing protein [Kofleriaceae bacterium]
MTKQLLVVTLLAACGGKQPANTTPEPARETATDGSAEMVPIETMDEINRLLDRKRTQVSRCITIAVEEQEVPKNVRGKVLLKIVISPSGKASTVEVVNSTLESKSLLECVKNNIREIAFPAVPKDYETSYTYGFETN